MDTAEPKKSVDGYDIFNFVALVALLGLCAGAIFMFFATGGPGKPYRIAQLSYTKQVAAGVSQYLAENDDHFPALGHWEGKVYRTWAQAVHPYVKMPVYSVPSEPRSGSDSETDEVTGAMGLNYSALNRTEENRLILRSLSEVGERPETTIGLGARVSRAHYDQRVILQHAPTRTLYLMNIEPPVASPHNSVSVGAWGTRFWSDQGMISADRAEGSHGLLRTIGDSGTKPAELTVSVGFLDGHCKSMPLPQLAAGTDCTDIKPDEPLPHPCRIRDLAKYLWGD